MAVDNNNLEAQEKPTRQGPGLLGLIKAMACISVIVIVEVVLATLLIPSARDTEALGRDLVAAKAGALAADVGPSTGQDFGRHDRDVREVDLGSFTVTRYNPETGSTLNIDFSLFGVVLADEEAEFAHLFEKSKIRVREQVIMTLHSAETSDLTDAGLGLIKRKILEKTNRALGKPLVREVLFSKFNFVER